MIKNKWLALENTIRIIMFLVLSPILVPLMILSIPFMVWDYICKKADEEMRKSYHV